MVDAAQAELQPFAQQAGAEVEIERIFGLERLKAARGTVAALDAAGQPHVAEGVEIDCGVAVADFLLETVGTAERGKNGAGVETGLQLEPGGVFAVVLGDAEVVGGFDQVFDAVAVVGEADIAGAQFAPIGGEIEAVADFEAAAFFRPQFEARGGGGGDVVDVAINGADFVDAGEAGGLGIAGEQALVVGQVVADGDSGRLGMGLDGFGLRPALLFGVVPPNFPRLRPADVPRVFIRSQIGNARAPLGGAAPMRVGARA